MKFLSLSEVQERVPYSRTQLWRLEKAGRFPKRVKLSPTKRPWIDEEVDQWIADRAAERGAEAV